MTPWEEYEQESNRIEQAEKRIVIRRKQMYKHLDKQRKKCKHEWESIGFGIGYNRCKLCGLNDLE